MTRPRSSPDDMRLRIVNSAEELFRRLGYTKTTVDEQDGYYRDETRQVKRTFTDKDGKQKTETIEETFPVWQPPRVYRSTCSTRFVMGGGRVEDVTFEGDGCVAEELK